MKKINIFFLTALIIISAGFFANIALAESPSDNLGWTDVTCKAAGGYWYYDSCLAAPPTLDLQVDIPGLSSKQIAIGTYIQAIYRFAVGAGAVLAVIVIMVGGFLWLTSAGNQTAIGAAKGYILGAIIGLVILLSSYLILYTINPKLTQFQPLRISYLPPQGLSRYGQFCTPSDATLQNEQVNQYYDINSKKLATDLTCGLRYRVNDPNSQDTCLGYDCSHIDGPQNNFCLPSALTGKEQNRDTVLYTCFGEDALRQSCEQINDDNTDDSGLGDGQSGCDAFNNALATGLAAISSHDPVTTYGTCVWWEHSAALDPLTDDGCAWCPQDIYKQVEQEFLGALGKDCKKLRVNDLVGPGQAQSEVDKDACANAVCLKYCGSISACE